MTSILFRSVRPDRCRPRRGFHGLDRPAWEALEARSLLSTVSGLETPDADRSAELGPYRNPASDPDAPGGLEGSEGSRISGVLQVLGTEPSSGARLLRSPERLSVRLDRPIADYSIGADLVLLRWDPDGSSEPVYDENAPLLSEYDPEVPNGLSVRLPGPLEPGQYRVVLATTTFLSGADGASLDPALPGSVLSEFRVQEPGLSFDDAEALGRITPSGLVQGGALNLAADPLAVRLYRFELGADQRLWRVGIEIQAQRIGSPLDATLALFDRGGRVLAASDTGRSDAPKDPFLFAGLRPGTYYVGVAGGGNRPDLEGGYDPRAGTFGRLGSASPGGEYELHIIADAAGAGAAVIGFQLDAADPTDPAPTHVRLQFSAAVWPPGTDASATIAALELRDEQGRAWPLHPAGFDEATATLTAAIGTRLPAGRYEVVAPEGGGWTDLAGLVPTASESPAGVLARFDVASGQPARDPDDLGLIYPEDTGESSRRLLELGPGESRSLRFVLAAPDFVRRTIETTGGEVVTELIQVATGLTWSIEPGTHRNLLDLLEPGEYEFRITALGPEPATVHLELLFDGYRLESLLRNGLGQGPALKLMLVAPGSTSLGSGRSASSGAVLVPLESDARLGPLPDGSPALLRLAAEGEESSSVVTLATRGGGSEAPGTLLPVTLGGSLVGMPRPGGGTISPVGPGSGVAVSWNVDAAALSASGLGPGEGGREGGAIVPSPPPTDGAPTVEPEPGIAAAALIDGVSAPGRLELLLRRLQESLIAFADDLRGDVGGAGITDSGVADGEAPVGALPSPEAVGGVEGNIDEADLQPPLGLTLIALAVVQLRRQLAQRLRRLTEQAHRASAASQRRGPRMPEPSRPRRSRAPGRLPPSGSRAVLPLAPPASRIRRGS